MAAAAAVAATKSELQQPPATAVVKALQQQRQQTPSPPSQQQQQQQAVVKEEDEKRGNANSTNSKAEGSTSNNELPPSGSSSSTPPLREQAQERMTATAAELEPAAAAAAVADDDEQPSTTMEPEIAIATDDGGDSKGNSSKNKQKSAKELRKAEKKSKKAEKQMTKKNKKMMMTTTTTTKQQQQQDVNRTNDDEKKQQQQQQRRTKSMKPDGGDNSGDQTTVAAKPRQLVEELKLFQNNHLLNQQDPLQQLHQQLNGLIRDGDDDIGRSNKGLPMRSSSSSSSKPLHSGHEVVATSTNGIICHDNSHLTATSNQQQQRELSRDGQQQQLDGIAAMQDSMMFNHDSSEDIFTVKKGVLWQQQHYEKFHQRLFSRWKKRYFILTTDYLVCFKRSSSKVGRSEMGKFLYKTALSDVTKICWSKPAKSDKGAIILYTNGQFNLYLWFKESLDDWMFMINESIERNKLRRSCIVKNGAYKVGPNPSLDGIISSNPTLINNNACELYENTTAIENRDQANLQTVVVPNGLLASKQSKNSSFITENSNHRISAHINDQEEIDRIRNGPNSSSQFEAITKLRSQQQQHGEEGDEEEVDSPIGCHKQNNNNSNNSDAKVNSSPLSACNNTNSSAESGGLKSIKHEHQVQQREAIDNDDDLDNSHKRTQPFENVQASGRGQNKGPIMIYDPASSNNGGSSLASLGRGNDDRLLSTTKGVATEDDDRLKTSSSDARSRSSTNDERNQTPNDLSSDRSVGCRDGVNGSSRPKITAENHHHHHSFDHSNNQPNLVRSSSSSRRSSKRKNSFEEDKTTTTERNSSIACDNEGKSNLRPTPSERQAIPLNPLIRKDDSWQSLVSLTRVGKVSAQAVAVAQRSLYAQHIMPESSKINSSRDGCGKQQQQQELLQYNRQHMINIESTVTPSRAAPPFLRQQSIQIPSGHRKLRPLPAFRQQQAASFDVAPSSPSAAVTQSNQQQHQMLLRQQQQMQFQQQLMQSNTSYQQKLLQLQLLHNSNNVDYIRQHNNNNGDSSTNNNDYGQIYWPESNHYGYSSMRSNLKSAASEFSFIRPSPSSHAQSTLPHNNNNNNHLALANSRVLNYVPQGQDLCSLNQQQQQQQQPIRSSLILSPSTSQTKGTHQQQSDSNNNDVGLMSPVLQQQQQYLVNPLTGERLINNQQQQDCEPPMRELPMKPNKKRTLNLNASDGSSLPKSSSLTSSIACFFRRAFSRRSKRNKRRSKLAESCSSSLGAFDGDNFSPHVPMVPSAFSTGSKSVDGRKNQNNNHNDNSNDNIKNINNLPIVQSQRMVDMIEAFTSKTQAAEIAAAQAKRIAEQPTQLTQASFNQQQFSALNNNNLVDSIGTPKMAQRQHQQHQQPKSHVNQFGSPLHKSNSISATMGLSSLIDVNNRRAYLYDNEMMAGALADAATGGASPMLLRSTKVMSANLTPLMSQHDQNVALFELENSLQQQQQQQQFFMSPRNSRPDQLPRPSSIYGQPSMISSPLITREERNNFGAHRNSMHNQHQFRDRDHGPSSSSASKFEIHRRHQMMKMPFQLDTTREVAEEISSPTTESRSLDYVGTLEQQQQQLCQSRRHIQAPEQNPYVRYPITRDNFDDMMISASPSSSKLHQRQLQHQQQQQRRHQQQAVVNPILQSPTMDTIYDNHPMLNGTTTELTSSSSSYSHYDNHNQLLMDRQRQSPALLSQTKLPGGGQMGAHFLPESIPPPTILPSSPRILATHSENPYSARRMNLSNSTQSYTPSHQLKSQFSATGGGCGGRESELTGGGGGLDSMMLINKKPSAIVTPSTPNRSVSNNFENDLNSSPTTDGYRNRQPSSSAHSPMLSRRMVNSQSSSNYQQSPLVSSQTRIINKGDRVQATIIGGGGDSVSGNGSYRFGQPVVNIAGAPGINLEPSLAASLLRGTNIDAYESSTFNRLTSSPSKGGGSKTFLVSTRLSKSMAYGRSSPPNNNDNDSISSSVIKDESTATARSSKDELSSSGGSRSINSSIGRGSLRRTKLTNTGTSSSQEDQHDESSSSDTHTDREAKSTKFNNNNEGEYKLEWKRKTTINDRVSSRQNRKETNNDKAI